MVSVNMGRDEIGNGLARRGALDEGAHLFCRLRADRRIEDGDRAVAYHKARVVAGRAAFGGKGAFAQGYRPQRPGIGGRRVSGRNHHQPVVSRLFRPRRHRRPPNLDRAIAAHRYSPGLPAPSRRSPILVSIHHSIRARLGDVARLPHLHADGATGSIDDPHSPRAVTQPFAGFAGQKCGRQQRQRAVTARAISGTATPESCYGEMADGNPLEDPIEPMEAKLAAALPEEPGWQFEPKWDGFRAIAVRDGDAVVIWSKSGKPLDRYFPDVVEVLRAVSARRFILDGEIVVPIGDVLSFSALQARLHPAPSRIARLARETPAQFMLFDLLQLDGDDLSTEPLERRRALLEQFHHKEGSERLRLSPRSLEVAQAREWLAAAGGALDGVVAKRLDLPYQFGERAMAKVKQHRTADCVIGGFRETADGSGVASLLLGLYNDAGLLDHVGFTSALPAAERPSLLKTLKRHVGSPGFSGKAPGGPSRWATERSVAWTPLRPELVVEVLYDQITDGRFRHGTRLLRWRRDKRPDQCSTDQLVREIIPAELDALVVQSR